jgi:hypothetical protein
MSIFDSILRKLAPDLCKTWDMLIAIHATAFQEYQAYQEKING